MTPSGTVTYTFTGSELAGLSASAYGWTGAAHSTTWTDQVTVTGAGSIPNSNSVGPLPAGIDYSFSAQYSGGGAYLANNSSPEPLTINKGTLTLNTAIYNAATNVAISGSQALGTSVYDTASFSGATGGFTPTIADVSYEFGASPAGSGAQSSATGALSAGSYSYSVTFAGDSNYNPITTPVVENVTINKGTLTLNTAIYNAATNVAISGSQALGTSVYDTASFSGATAGFTPTIADVSYEFGASPAGSGAQSSTTGALGAGSYSYSVTFAGDSNYNAITTPVVENLTVNKGTLTLSTAIYNAATNAAISGSQALGTSVYDTASFSGATAGFTPTIADVSYEFGASPAGSGASRVRQGRWVRAVTRTR